MTLAEQYKSAKRELGYSIGWAEMIGKMYHGGGTGIGKVVKVDVSAATVYYQQYDDAKNYWDIPDALKPYLNEVIKAEMKSLVEKAIAKQEKHVRELAKAATVEMQEAMADAGIDVDEHTEVKA